MAKAHGIAFNMLFNIITYAELTKKNPSEAIATEGLKRVNYLP